MEHQPLAVVVLAAGLGKRMVSQQPKVLHRLAGLPLAAHVLRTLAPLDRDTILESVRKTGKAMVVHEDNLTGGFGAEVAATIAHHAFDSLDGPVVRVAAPDVPGMPFNTPQEDFFMPSPDKIAEAMRQLAAY